MTNFQNNFITTVSANSDIGSTVTSIDTVPSVDAPFYLTFDYKNLNGNFEVIYCTGKGAGTVTHSATTKSHPIGESIAMTITAEAIDNIFQKNDELSGNAQILAQTGSIIAYGKNVAPSGWIACDGSAISRTTYANLFSVIGTTYGAGDGSTTFLVPNMNGSVIGAYKSGGQTFTSLGLKLGSKTINTSHTHTISADHGHPAGAGSTSGLDASHVGDGSPIEAWVPDTNHQHTLYADSISGASTLAMSTDGSTTQNTMSQFITVFYIIKI